MNSETKWFPVVTITWDDKLYRFIVTREDVNQALGLTPDHEIGLGLSDTQMMTIANWCGEDLTTVSLRRDVLRTVLDDLGVRDTQEVSHENNDQDTRHQRRDQVATLDAREDPGRDTD